MTRKLLIVGGVAGGATAAARARRIDEHADIILIERGAFVSFANCGLPYYIGGVIENRDDLFVTTPEMLRDRYRIDVRTLSAVTAIDRKNRKLAIEEVKTGRCYEESYDYLILSPGAEPVRPPIPGVDLDSVLTLRNIPDSDRIKEILDLEKPDTALVVGGGFIGLEMAENLAGRSVKTTIVEMAEQVMPPLDPEMARIVQAHLAEKGITVKLNTRAESFFRYEQRTAVSTDRGETLECDLVILSIGVKPENDLARQAGLEIDENGGIRVDAGMRTSDPRIYAIGDAAAVTDLVTGMPTLPLLAGPANKQGRIAADNAMGRRSVFKGTLGSAIVQIFGLSAASTGAGEKTLIRENRPYLTSYTHSGSHAAYYPGAEMMSVKLLFTPGTGRLLGAQIIGGKGVDKRIDVLAAALKGGMTVYDLEELELAYAPPYSSAKDPVNIAGFVASNLLKGDLEIIHWKEIGEMNAEKTVLVDLRNTEELESEGRIDGAIHIPLETLRTRVAELDRRKTYLLFCAVGLRGYIGYRILVQNGFTVKNLSGGYLTYRVSKEKVKLPGFRA